MTLIIKSAPVDSTKYIKNALSNIDPLELAHANERSCIGMRLNSGTYGIIMIAGASGLLRRSTDYGNTWTTIDCIFGTTQVRGIATNGSGQWIVVGSSGKISYSDDDGATWTTVIARAFQINSVIWNSVLALWVIAGTAGTIETSPDRIAWTARASGLAGSAVWDLAVDTNGYMLATCRAVAKYTTSTDGITWNNYVTTEVLEGGAINVSGNWYFPNSNGIYITSDRVTLSHIAFAWANYPRDIAYSYALGCFVIATLNMGLYLSFDSCKTFYALNLPFVNTNRFNRIIFDYGYTDRRLFLIANNTSKSVFKSQLAIEG